jgi:hypothetical protein
MVRGWMCKMSRHRCFGVAFGHTKCEKGTMGLSTRVLGFARINHF